MLWDLLERMQGEIAGELRRMLGQDPLDQATIEAGRSRRVEALKKCAASSTSDIERHDMWCAMHIEQGWTFGDAYDPEKKTHPNLRPWDELPAEDRCKAKIFAIIAKYGAQIEGSFGGGITTPVSDKPESSPN